MLMKVAVRSSATAENLPDASFAGQQETFLNISGIENVKRDKGVFASLFNDRAISCVHQGFGHELVALLQVFGAWFVLKPALLVSCLLWILRAVF